MNTEHTEWMKGERLEAGGPGRHQAGQQEYGTRKKHSRLGLTSLKQSNLLSNLSGAAVSSFLK